MTTRTRLARLVSTYNNPLLVGLIDAVLVFVLSMITLIASFALYNASDRGRWFMPMEFENVATTQAVVAAMVGLASMANSVLLRSEPRLIRSMFRTVWRTILVMLAATVVIWIMGSIRELVALPSYPYGFDPIKLLQAFGAFGLAAAPIGYRRLGFIRFTNSK